MWYPSVVLTDQGINFTSNLFGKICDKGDHILLRVPCQGKMNKYQWLGPYTILDTPSEVTHVLNLTTCNRSKRVEHRNALKPYHDDISPIKCIIAWGSDNEGVIPLPQTSYSQPGSALRNSFPPLDHLSEERRTPVQTLISNFLDVLDKRPCPECSWIQWSLRLQKTTNFTEYLQIPEKKIAAMKKEIQSLQDDGIWPSK